MFGPENARSLVEKVEGLGRAARELALFGETEPALAAECGVEVLALEAKSILSGGVPQRVAALAGRTALSGRPVEISGADLSALERLEGVLALASSRIERRRMELEAQAGPSVVDRIAPVLGGIVLDKAFGLIKSIF